MPRTLYTPTDRAGLAIASVFPDAILVSKSDDEDVFQVGTCRLTCRYWTRGGDFVSKQIMGCATAVQSGQLQSANAGAVEEQVYQTQSIVGIVGPEDAVGDVAVALAARFSGVLIDGEEAVIAEPTAAPVRDGE